MYHVYMVYHVNITVSALIFGGHEVLKKTWFVSGHYCCVLLWFYSAGWFGFKSWQRRFHALQCSCCISSHIHTYIHTDRQTDRQIKM